MGKLPLWKSKWLITLEDTPENPLTRKRILDWMATTGYIENFTRSKIHALDRDYTEDYISDIWLQICEIPEEKLVEIYRSGKGRFTNYLKGLIMNNIRSVESNLYKRIKKPRVNEVYLTDYQWNYLIHNDEVEADKQIAVIDKDIYNKVIFDYEKDPIKSEINLVEEWEDPKQ